MNKEELRKKLEPKKFNNVTMEFLTKAVNVMLLFEHFHFFV